MADEKPNKYVEQQSLPIPTYEEAISSRPSSSQSFLGASEVSHDAERQGLLSRRESRYTGHEEHTVESARSSLDFQPSSHEGSPRTSLQGLRREMEQMDMLELEESEPNQHSLRASSLSKRITSLTHSLSSLNLPFRQYLPSRDYIRARMPMWPKNLQMNWIIFGRIFALLLVVSLAYLLFVSDLFTVGRRRGMQMYDPESVRIFLQEHVNETQISQYLEYATRFDHIAGTKGNFVLAQWVETLFQAASLEDVGLERFDVYLNYPKPSGRRVAVIEPADKAWEALIEEIPLYTDPPREQTLVFHGHSRSGNVTGPLIYANYGSREDFQKLKEVGIDVKGSIALVRYYGSQGDRALKVKAAELAGAVGCIIYSDPAEDGFSKGAVFPDGRYMPRDGVQRGSVAMTAWVAGDVLSKGFASLPGESRRDSKDDNTGLNNIPSIPLAWRDAQELLRVLKGHGKEITKSANSELGEDWIGGVPDIEWWTGDKTSPIVQLKNEQDEEERQPIYNVVGRFTGLEQPEKSIIVGNHRDAWAFGAADPGSGTAVFLEVIRIFGELRKLGWAPLRTVEFASWDGEEYNLIGSTEHVESRMDDIRRNGFAYLNVDVAVVGTDFEPAGCPVFEKALLRVLDRIYDPNTNNTLRSIWDDRSRALKGLGAGSDYVAFQHMAGTSSIDLSFSGPPFPYHSVYDNYDWMRLFGDPGFKYHRALAQAWALLILEMSDSPVLPFDFQAYARAVKGYVDDLDKHAAVKVSRHEAFDLKPLQNAAEEFVQNAREFHEFDQSWSDAVFGRGGLETNVMAIRRMSHNTRMANFETNLLDVDGGVSAVSRFAPAPLSCLTNILA